MNYRSYRSSEEAIRSFTKKDKEYIIVWHELGFLEKVREHYHTKANEWIVINNGKFEMLIDGRSIYFNIGFKNDNGFIVIPLPKGTKHLLFAKSKISYFVVRDRKDRNIYTRRKRK